MSDSDTWGTVLEALSNPYRRRVLVELLHREDGEADPLDAAADGDEDREQLRTRLVHAHLPKLDDSGFVDWDPSADAVERGANWDDLEPVLCLIERHEDELPDGWT